MSAVAPAAVDVRPVRPVRANSVPAPAPDLNAEGVGPPLPSHIVAPGNADPAPAPSDDSWRLMLLFAVFVVAPLVVVAAVWAVAAIDTLWALVLALAVYLAVTLFVCATVAFVVSGHVPLGARSHHAG